MRDIQRISFGPLAPIVHGHALGVRWISYHRRMPSRTLPKVWKVPSPTSGASNAKIVLPPTTSQFELITREGEEIDIFLEAGEDVLFCLVCGEGHNSKHYPHGACPICEKFHAHEVCLGCEDCRGSHVTDICRM